MNHIEEIPSCNVIQALRLQAAREQSAMHAVNLALGARISRLDLQVLQTAEGTQCTLDGLALISGEQLADTHSFIDHAKPHGTSRQLHKCIAGGTAHAVFNGQVMVRPSAQQTDSAQSSRNLLLSSKAHVDTQPQLEIFADDVKCTHGATVGQLDSDEVFYLQSRGLSETVASGRMRLPRIISACSTASCVVTSVSPDTVATTAGLPPS